MLQHAADSSRSTRLSNANGFAIEIALTVAAAVLEQPARLLLGFDALGERREAEAVGDAQEHLGDRAVAFVVGQAHDERAVDLDHVDRQLFEIRERRIAGAEIVDCDGEAPAAKQIDRVHRALDILHRGGLGDFDAEMIDETRIGIERRAQFGDERNVVEHLRRPN